MHSFVSCLMHCVFSTKERRKLITPELQERLYPYLGGIARENKMKRRLVELKITFMRCCRFLQLYQLQSPFSFSKVILPSGFTRHFPTNACLNGKRDTGRSALPSREWKTQ